MASFEDPLRALNAIKDEGVVEDYAIAGAMAILFWTEPVPTYDLDVLVFLPRTESPPVSLDSVYRWTASRGYPAKDEHVIIEGLPTQFIPSPNALADEAIATAELLDYKGTKVRVVLPEYLVASTPCPKHALRNAAKERRCSSTGRG